MHLLQSLFAFLFFYSFFVSKKLIAFESSLSDSFDLSTYTLNLLLMCMKGGSCSAWGSSLLEKSEKIGNWSCQKSFSKQVLWTCLTRNLCFVTVKFEISRPHSLFPPWDWQCPLDISFKGNSIKWVGWLLCSQILSLKSKTGHRKKWKLDYNPRYGPACVNILRHKLKLCKWYMLVNDASLKHMNYSLYNLIR